jgi:hypothetical protein
MFIIRLFFLSHNLGMVVLAKDEARKFYAKTFFLFFIIIVIFLFFLTSCNELVFFIGQSFPPN